MWPYWLMFLLPAIAALSESRLAAGGELRAARWLNLNNAWLGVAAVLTLVIGYRYQVGGDWFSYLDGMRDAYFRSLYVSITEDDPGYKVLEWLAVELDWGIFGVNFISAALFSLGLSVFCRSLPRSWLALTVAIPYFVIIVAMGYTRQGVAIGLAMLGLVALGRQQVWPFLGWVLLAATFHKSAVLLLPIAVLAVTRRRLVTAAWVGVVTLVAYGLMLEQSVEALKVNYVEAEYQSEGALVRLLMNALPAVLLLLFRRRFGMSLPQMQLWFWFALIALALFGVYYLTPASTAVDRVGLYMLPLQLVVFSYLPEVFGGSRSRNQALVGAVVFYYAAVEFVWLNFAVHAPLWIPYRFWLLE